MVDRKLTPIESNEQLPLEEDIEGENPQDSFQNSRDFSRLNS